jgi:protein-S-isoprenylcysteine O-methyltransferase Ste14
MSERHHGLGAEHPEWDKIQNILIALILASLALDFLSQIYFGHSTIMFNVINYPVLVIPSILLMAMGYKLVSESHRVALQQSNEPKLVEDGVYSLVRHPMYLGEVLFLLGPIILEFSLAALTLWATLMYFCNWAAIYEERDLLRIMPEEYKAYQRRVPKWVPRRLRLQRNAQ